MTKGGKHKFKIGDWVQSHYRANWKGIVLEVTPRSGIGDLCLVQPKFTSYGVKLRKVKARTLDEAWLKRVEIVPNTK